MSRFLPRFSLLTLFAAMLLFVSLAGWAKFHVDLWREEEAVLADLTKAGVVVEYSRDDGDMVMPQPSSERAPAYLAPVRALTPYRNRIKQICLGAEAPPELLDRTAQLPCVEVVGVARAYPSPRPPLEPILELAGLDVAPLPAPTIPNREEPLPPGEALDVESATAVLRQFRQTWDSPPARPLLGSRRSVTTTENFGEFHEFRARGDLAMLIVEPGSLVTATRESSDGFLLEADGLRQMFRLERERDLREAFDGETAVLFAYEPRKELSQNLGSYGIADRVDAAIASAGPDAVRRLDDRRVRIDLAEIVVEHSAAACRETFAIALVARTDLDGALEGWDIRGRREQESANRRELATIDDMARGELRREGDWVVAESWSIARLIPLVGPQPAGLPEFPASERTAGVARYDFAFDLDLSRITPPALDAKTFPPRRELPWLTWHRATFAVSLGLLAFVGVGKVIRWSRRDAPVQGPVDEPLPGETAKR